MGKGQQLYIVFMWWIIAFNFERALPRFSPGRIVTEGTITFNGIIATVLCCYYDSVATVITTLKCDRDLVLIVVWVRLAILVISSLCFGRLL